MDEVRGQPAWVERCVRARHGEVECAWDPDGGSSEFRGLHGDVACGDDEEGHQGGADF